MNLQDVSHIHIPDGDVRMIHDSDNRLLWGAVGYNVLFSGNTYQQTYTGKNLFNAGAPISDRYITDAGTWAQGQGASRYINQEYSSTPNTTYAFSFSAKTSGAFVRFAEFNNNGVFTKRTLINTSGATITTRSDTAKILWSIDASSSNHFTDLQIEQGSTVTSYEPYVGGQASPSPDYPQQIQTVTGTQTISINGTNYPISLGSLELCGLVDDGAGGYLYNDGIYKNLGDGKWYVKKHTGKLKLQSSQGWSKSSITSLSRFFIRNYFPEGTLAVDRTKAVVISNYFIGISQNQSDQRDTGISQLGSRGIMINVTNGVYADATAFNAWLDSNDVVSYYALATPTDTAITDQTLIAQLEAIYNLVRRYGYNFVVSASGNNLPIIIDRTLL